MNPLLIRRRGMMQAQQGGLPYDAEVEYLESDGNQKMITPIAGTNTVKIEGKYQLTKTVTKYLFGTSVSSTTTTLRAYIGSPGNWRFGGCYRAMNTANLNIHTFKVSSASLIFDGDTFSWNGSTGTFSDGNIAIFGLRSVDGLPCRFYYFKIYKNNVLVFDGKPVRVGTVGYMYDSISGQLFGNAGTGDFVLGPDIQ